MAGVSVPIAPAANSHSSPDSILEDDSLGPNGAPSSLWATSPSPTSQAPRTPAPLQKRRRVTRACDECRRKKIKCDGKQPCTHCTVYSYDCTYDQPSNRRRNPAPQYIEALEVRLQRAEALLRTFLPTVDLNDPNIDVAIQKQQAQAKSTKAAGSGSVPKSAEIADAEQDAHLRSMIASTGQLDLDENGLWDFHGGSSGTVFVRRMREKFGGLLGMAENGAPFLPRLPRPSPSAIFGPSHSSYSDSPLDSGLPNIIDLPSKEIALMLCGNALDLACSLIRFVHQPTFYEMLNRIYDVPVETFGNDENQFLPLLYVVLALGCMFRPNDLDPQSPLPSTYKTGLDQGLKYFRAGRQMMDITECRDIISLQAVIFMTLFLQSTANLSTCYSYIGIALRSALRMGLHRNLAEHFNPIEREVRRRVFWIVRKMDTYVSALLGFPQMLSIDDIDQVLPTEVDDEYITKDGILPMPEGKSSMYAAPNAHTALMGILAKVIKYIYPTKGIEQFAQGSASSSYGISHAKIKEIEKDLADWLDKLPMVLRPGGNVSPDLLRVQQLLRLAYAHVQMMLYRPFLHYVSKKPCAGKVIDDRSYACAAACVSVSRNIVHITTEMRKRGLLLGAYWFTMYTTFFSILSLVFFVLENSDSAGSREILSDAYDGKAALDGLAERSQAADRCSIALKSLFDELPQRLQETRSSLIVSKKKRSAPEPNPLEERNNISERPKSESSPTNISTRSTTFPISTPARSSDSQRSSIDGVQFHMNTMSNPNLRQNYHDLIPSADLSNAGTPESVATPTSISQQPYSSHQFSLNNPFPDMSAMMFSSTDPFAYPPNQPMMEFDSIKQENLSNFNLSSNSNMYMPESNTGLNVYDDLQGQIFGPLPPFLTQGGQNTQQFDFQNELDLIGNTIDSGLNPPAMDFHSGLTPHPEINFLLSGDSDDWNCML